MISITKSFSMLQRAHLASHLLPWLLIIAAFMIFRDSLTLGTQVLVMILFTLSLDLALGYAGIVTLGHAVFFGFGAYAAGLIALHLTNNPLLGLLYATALTALLGMIIGVCILHTHGATLLALTLAIGSLAGELPNHLRSLTGGDDGLQGISIAPLFGLFRFDLWGKTSYIYAAAVLLVWFVIAVGIVRSPFGRSIDAIRQNARRMRAIGTPVWKRMIVMFTLSAAMAGTAGALSAQTTRFVGMNSLSVVLSGGVVIMLVVGGTRRLYGAFIGATVYMIVHDVASQLNPFYWMLVIGVMLIATVMFLENGLLSLGDRGTQMAATWRRKVTRK